MCNEHVRVLLVFVAQLQSTYGTMILTLLSSKKIRPLLDLGDCWRITKSDADSLRKATAAAVMSERRQDTSRRSSHRH